MVDTKLLVHRLMNNNTGERIELAFDDLIHLIKSGINVIGRERTLVEIHDKPITIVGDIHGTLIHLINIFSTIGFPWRIGSPRYLFLGDYVDRGRQSLECVVLLLALKTTFKHRITLLRGNHECRIINEIYGFKAELNERYDEKQAATLFDEFNRLFDYLPLAAIIDGRILCMHGGLSPKLTSLNDIRTISRPLSDLDRNSLAMDLLWSDPNPNKSMRGFQTNTMRNVSCFFGADVIERICRELNIDMVIRAHQAMHNGHSFYNGRHLLTIFSATNYSAGNRGAVVTYSGADIRFTLFNQIEEHGCSGALKFRRIYNDSPR